MFLCLMPKHGTLYMYWPAGRPADHNLPHTMMDMPCTHTYTHTHTHTHSLILTHTHVIVNEHVHVLGGK